MVALEAGLTAVAGYCHDFSICEASICPQGYGCRPDVMICVDTRKTGCGTAIFNYR